MRMNTSSRKSTLQNKEPKQETMYANLHKYQTQSTAQQLAP
jgi:hypothetical protein